MSKSSSHSKYPFNYVYFFLSFAQEIIDEPILEIFTEIREEPQDLIAEFLNEQENLVEFLTSPFPKRSRLHSFCEHIFTMRTVSDVYFEADNLRREEYEELLLTKILDAYQLPYISFDGWFNGQEDSDRPNPCYGLTLIKAEERIENYYEFLSQKGMFQNICEILADEMFFILFNNRNFLRKFNLLLSEFFINSEVIHMDDKNLKNKKIKRICIPKWVKRTIYYRERGRCGFCQKDITGLVSISNIENYDHIVPLALGGLNDVTNIQLLCEKCNKTKKHFSSDAAIYYEKWY